MKKLLVSAAVIASLSLGACNSAPSKAASNDYATIIAEAKAAHEVAASKGNVWKQKKMKLAYVDHYIAEAAKAKAKGDEAGALKMAKLALKSANAEVLQSERYADLQPAWRK